MQRHTIPGFIRVGTVVLRLALRTRVRVCDRADRPDFQ